MSALSFRYINRKSQTIVEIPSKARPEIGIRLTRELFFLKNGPNTTSFCYFRPIYDKYSTYDYKKHRWRAWDSNPGPQDGRRRQIH